FPEVARTQDSGLCGFAVDPKDVNEEEDPRCEECLCNCYKSPSSVQKGNYTTSSLDLQIATRGLPIIVSRRYKTDKAIDGLMGYGWTTNLTSRVVVTAYLLTAPSTYLNEGDVIMPNGGLYKFTQNPDGTFAPPAGSHDKLVKNADGTFDLTFKLSRNHNHYDAFGSLASMVDAYGNTLTFTNDASGKPQQVIDSTGSGRYITFTYDANGHIWKIIDSTGRQIVYSYSGGTMVSVLDAASRTTTYTYWFGRFTPLLSSVKDNWNREITSITYD